MHSYQVSLLFLNLLARTSYLPKDEMRCINF